MSAETYLYISGDKFCVLLLLKFTYCILVLKLSKCWSFSAENYFCVLVLKVICFLRFRTETFHLYKIFVFFFHFELSLCCLFNQTTSYLNMPVSNDREPYEEPLHVATLSFCVVFRCLKHFGFLLLCCLVRSYFLL